MMAHEYPYFSSCNRFAKLIEPIVRSECMPRPGAGPSDTEVIFIAIKEEAGFGTVKYHASYLWPEPPGPGYEGMIGDDGALMLGTYLVNMNFDPNSMAGVAADIIATQWLRDVLCQYVDVDQGRLNERADARLDTTKRDDQVWVFVVVGGDEEDNDLYLYNHDGTLVE